MVAYNILANFFVLASFSTITLVKSSIFVAIIANFNLYLSL